MADRANVHDQWVLGPDDTPFFTKSWSPAGQPKAHVLFVHGLSEHIGRYNALFSRLASEPYNIDVFAFDQRGHGRTAHTPLGATSPEVTKWRQEGKTVKLEPSTKRRTGGWSRVMPDIEWFVHYASQRAHGSKVFLYGFSMGGGQVLGFCTRSAAPPSQQTLGLVAGVIAGGPMIRRTHATPWLILKGGSLLANLGAGHMLIPTTINYEHLSHNAKTNEETKTDPLCEQVGSLRGIADMINNGALLVATETIQKFPKALPLLIYHGTDDPICSFDASAEFIKRCPATDKTFYPFKGMLHEVHNELEPTPTENATLVGEWIVARVNKTAKTSTATAPAPQTETSAAKL